MNDDMEISNAAFIINDLTRFIIDKNIIINQIIDVYDKKTNIFYEAKIIHINKNKIKIHFINGCSKWINKYAYLCKWRFHNQNIYLLY